MNDDARILNCIVARAATLAERIEQRHVFVGKVAPDVSASEARYRRWCERATAGDSDLFEKRLSWEGVDAKLARRIVTDDPPLIFEVLPSWAEVLSDIVASLRRPREIAAELEQRGISTAQPIPFEDALLPLCVVARRRLARRVGENGLRHIRDGATLDFERALLARLSSLGARAFHEVLDKARPIGARWMLVAGTPSALPARALYDRVVRELLEAAFLPVFDAYPVLARQMATAIEQWVECVAEFSERFTADREVLGALVGRAPSYAEHVELSLSDPHNGGRTVFIVHLEGGGRVVYKPKPLALDVAYARLLDWISSRGDLLDLRTPRTLDRGSYGFSEFIEQAPLADAQAAHRFYERAGMLLAVMYLLDGSDCHYENVIACGEHPYIVDLETVMQHLHGRDEDDDIAEVVATERLRHSVLRTGLLPSFRFNALTRRAYDMSGLGACSPEHMVSSSRQWIDVNTDHMRLEIQKAPRPVALPNVPKLDGVALEPCDYLDAIIGGFQRTYRCFLREKHVLRATVLKAFARARVRYLFRDTRVYSLLLHEAQDPRLLGNGVDRGIEFEGLSRIFVKDAECPADWSVFKAEVEALERGDVPYFAADADSTSLSCGVREPLDGFFPQPSFGTEIARLDGLSERDLVLQTTIIGGCFSARAATVVPAEQRASNDADERPLDENELLDEAVRLGESLERHALKAGEGSASWMGLQYMPSVQGFSFQPIRQNLYDGTVGVALFLAALDRVLCSRRGAGTRKFAVLGRSAIASLRSFVASSKAEDLRLFVRVRGMGGTNGVGSIIYGFIKLADWLGDPTLVDAAELLATLITTELVDADESLDVVSGAAGLIPPLLALYQERPHSWLHDLARRAGDHLVRSMTVHGAWKTIARRELTGFSHGAAGISHALARLGRAIGEQKYLRAARRGFAYESALYRPDQRNWPDFRDEVVGDGGGPGFKWSFCHGAPGVGLGRLDSLRDAPEVERDVELALQATRSVVTGSDSICCGSMGRSEILLTAGRKLGRPEWIEDAVRRAAGVVRRARSGGQYTLQPVPKPVFSPGFFQGVSGVGYSLLRLVDPSLGCVLLWE